ncbi:MAG: hypothetical protein WDW36_005202 [Sanguina aurantia]
MAYARKVDLQALKQVLTQAVSSAAADWTSGCKASIACGSLVVKAIKEKRNIIITLDQALALLFFAGLLLQALFLAWLRPALFGFIYYAFLGLALGLGISYVYYRNMIVKAESNYVMSTTLGMKGLQHLLGSLPAWLQYTHKDKVEWLNTLLAKVWPFYDKAVCEMIKEATEQQFAKSLKAMTVPGLKRLGFRQLTFGEAPFRIEGLTCDDSRKDELHIEVEVRWCGDANITLAVESVAGDKLSICPKVTNVSFAGTLRIILKPLVAEVPGFAAAQITFVRPPLIKYSLNFGSALGGGITAKPVTLFLDMMLRQALQDSMVWPQRMVVKAVAGDKYARAVEGMALRSVGVLKVNVLGASGLLPRNPLVNAKVNSLVALTTDHLHTVETTTTRGTDPVYGDTFFLLVQEPLDQVVRVTVQDVDLFSPRELLTLQLHNTLGSRHVLGRAAVDVADACRAEGEVITRRAPLGAGDWSAAAGPGKGQGFVHLSMQYRSFRSFEMVQPRAAAQKSKASQFHDRPSIITPSGMLMVTVLEARNLVAAGTSHASNVAVRVKLGKKDETLSIRAEMNKGNPRFKALKSSITFFNVKDDTILKIKVTEAVLVAGGGDDLGVLKLATHDVAEAQDFDELAGVPQAGFLSSWMRLEEAATHNAEIKLQIRYVPGWESDDDQE